MRVESRKPRAVPTLLPVLLALAISAAASPALAQINFADVANKKAVGIGIYYGYGTMDLQAAPASASNEVKGYTDVLPSSIPGTGFAIGLSYGHWGFVVGQDDNTIGINKFADVNQTPGNAADDVYVMSVHRTNTSITVFWQPVRFFYFGLGQDMGSLAFDQINPNGQEVTHRIGYEHNFYTLALGFDPEKNRVGPVFTIFTKRPTDPGNFDGPVNAVGLGIYF
jgi:hypothetical protein